MNSFISIFATVPEKQQLQSKLTNFENTLKDLDYEGAASEHEFRICVN